MQGAGGVYIVTVADAYCSPPGVAAVTYSLSASLVPIGTALPGLPSLTPWPSVSSYNLVAPSAAPVPFHVITFLGPLPVNASSTLPAASEYHYFSFNNPVLAAFTVTFVVAPAPSFYAASLNLGTSAPGGATHNSFNAVRSCTVYFSGVKTCSFNVYSLESIYTPSSTFYVQVSATNPISYIVEVSYTFLGELPPPPPFTVGTLLPGAPPIIQTADALSWNMYRFVAPAPGPITFSLTTIYATCGWAGLYVGTLDDTHPTSSDFTFPTYRWFAGGTPTGAVAVTTIDPYYQVRNGVLHSAAMCVSVHL